MLTFNMLLQRKELEPSHVRLLRHCGATALQERQIRDGAFRLEEGFQRYQERQANPEVIDQLRAARYFAGFIVEPITKKTVFVGVWERLGERAEHLGDPISIRSKGRPEDSHVEFNTRRLSEFDDYVGRLVIAWGPGHRKWVQRADNQDKSILELREAQSDPEYPGHLRLKLALGGIEALYPSWIQVLRAARGIYLLVHRESGQQYVGSACGVDGFYGRWSGYADGHGGNVALKQLGAPAEAFDVTILEVAGSDYGDEAILERESLWKQKLGTRVKGLNRN